MRTVDDQPRLREAILPPEAVVFPKQLARIDELLNDRVLSKMWKTNLWGSNTRCSVLTWAAGVLVGRG